MVNIMLQGPIHVNRCPRAELAENSGVTAEAVKRQDNGLQEPCIDNLLNAFVLILLKRNAAELRNPSTGLTKPIDTVCLG